MTKPRQLTLGLPHRAAMGRDDFLVGASNAAAHAAVEAWPDWPHQALLLIGPEGSGKTHLGEMWRHMSGAERVEAGGLSAEAVPGLSELQAVLVEDVGHAGDETALFHLLNEAERRSHSLLLTARGEPATLPIALPDLRSRLSRVPVVALGPPDDMLIEALLVKLFADRQTAIEPDLVRFLVPRVERSFKAVADTVARLDEAGVAEQRAVTRAFAARILRETSRT